MELSIQKILTLLQAEYPNSFANMDARTMALKVELWKREFENDNPDLVYAAVRLYMKSPERFAPTIGQIREKMQRLTEQEELPEQSAWVLVSKACRNGLYGYKKEFAKLPPDVQEAVGAPEQLKVWAAMDSETIESVVASNFMRNYRTQRIRKKENAMLPPDIRKMLGGVAEGMKMIEQEV